MRRYLSTATPERPDRAGRDWQQLARLGIWYGWRALLITVVVALLAGVVYPASRTAIPEDPLLQSFDCASPPCFPHTAASRSGDVLVKLPPIGYALALLLCLPAAIVGVRDLLAGRLPAARQLIVPFLATLLVLLATDVVPRVLNPCLAFGPQLGGLCGEFVGRWDVRDRWSTLHHTLLGALPFTLLFGWLSGRFRKSTATGV